MLQEIVKAVHSPAVKERFTALGTEPVGNSAEACGELLRAEIAKWTKVVRAAGASDVIQTVRLDARTGRIIGLLGF